MKKECLIIELMDRISEQTDFRVYVCSFHSKLRLKL
jgi:hypothetical protein